MTFEEWFEQAYPEGSLGPREMRELCKAVARAAWEASRENIRYWDL
jgi:hypothetical protein